MPGYAAFATHTCHVTPGCGYTHTLPATLCGLCHTTLPGSACTTLRFVATRSGSLVTDCRSSRTYLTGLYWFVWFCRSGLPPFARGLRTVAFIHAVRSRLRVCACPLRVHTPRWVTGLRCCVARWFCLLPFTRYYVLLRLSSTTTGFYRTFHGYTCGYARCHGCRAHGCVYVRFAFTQFTFCHALRFWFTAWFAVTCVRYYGYCAHTAGSAPYAPPHTVTPRLPPFGYGCCHLWFWFCGSRSTGYFGSVTLRLRTFARLVILGWLRITHTRSVYVGCHCRLRYTHCATVGFGYVPAVLYLPRLLQLPFWFLRMRLRFAFRFMPVPGWLDYLYTFIRFTRSATLPFHRSSPVTRLVVCVLVTFVLHFVAATVWLVTAHTRIYVPALPHVCTIAPHGYAPTCHTFGSPRGSAVVTVGFYRSGWFAVHVHMRYLPVGLHTFWFCVLRTPARRPGYARRYIWFGSACGYYTTHTLYTVCAHTHAAALRLPRLTPTPPLLQHHRAVVDLPLPTTPRTFSHTTVVPIRLPWLRYRICWFVRSAVPARFTAVGCRARTHCVRSVRTRCGCCRSFVRLVTGYSIRLRFRYHRFTFAVTLSRLHVHTLRTVAAALRYRLPAVGYLCSAV